MLICSRTVACCDPASRCGGRRRRGGVARELTLGRRNRGLRRPAPSASASTSAIWAAFREPDRHRARRACPRARPGRRHRPRARVDDAQFARPSPCRAAAGRGRRRARRVPREPRPRPVVVLVRYTSTRTRWTRAAQGAASRPSTPVGEDARLDADLALEQRGTDSIAPSSARLTDTTSGGAHERHRVDPVRRARQVDVLLRRAGDSRPGAPARTAATTASCVAAPRLSIPSAGRRGCRCTSPRRRRGRRARRPRSPRPTPAPRGDRPDRRSR